MVFDRAAGLALFEGGVRAELGWATLRAERAAWWPAARRLYVEGSVRLEAGQAVVECEQAVFHMDRGEGILRKARILAVVGEGEQIVPTHVDAGTLRITFSRTFDPKDPAAFRDELRWIGRPGEISVCPHALPDVSLKSRRVSARLWRDGRLVGEGKERKEVFVDESFDGGLARMGFGTFRLLGIPLFPVPPYVWDLKDPLLKSVEFGSRRRFGSYARTVWGQTWEARRFELVRDLGLRKITVLADVDRYQRRGWAGGPRIHYSGRGFSGKLEAYGLEDQGWKRPDKAGESLKEDQDRWRLHFLHEHDLGDGWTVLAEIHRLSDENFRRAFFEAEERSGRPVENRLWLQKNGEDYTFWLTEQARNNAFFTTTDYLPQAGLETFPTPVGSTDLLHSSRTELANVRRNLADTGRLIDGDSYRTIRGDSFQQISAPFQEGEVAVEPRVGARLTAYEEDALRRESVERGVASYGASLSTERFRVFDSGSRLWDADRIRHNVIPRADWSATARPTAPPRRLLQFDEIDAIDQRETVDLSLRNLLLTKRGEPRRSATLADVDWRTTWFPHPLRDHPVTVPVDRTPSREFSDFVQDAFVFPRDWITARSRTSYDTYAGEASEQVTGLSLRTGDTRVMDRGGQYPLSAELSRTSRDLAAAAERKEKVHDPFAEAGVGVGVEHRFRRDLDEKIHLILEVQFTSRWGMSFQQTRELAPESRWGTRRVTVRRQFHDGALEFHYDVDKENDERILSFELSTYAF